MWNSENGRKENPFHLRCLHYSSGEVFVTTYGSSKLENICSYFSPLKYLVKSFSNIRPCVLLHRIFTETFQTLRRFQHTRDNVRFLAFSPKYAENY